MNTSLKWLALASLANLVGNSVGTIIALQQNLRAGLGSIANGPDVLQDFLGLKGTALSAPLSFLFIQLVTTLFALRPGRLGRIGIAGLTFIGLFYTLAQAGEPIVLRQLHPGGFDLTQFSILLVNIASSILMFWIGIKSWRLHRTSPAIATQPRP
jgi:hypothetical protein